MNSRGVTGRMCKIRRGIPYIMELANRNIFGLPSSTGFNFSQAAIPLLLKSTNLEHPPTLIFTGEKWFKLGFCSRY